MTKETEIMKYLHDNVFDPILNSKTAPSDLKKGVRITIMRMEKLNARKMVHYFWSAISGTEKSNAFAKRMKTEGFIRFEECLEEFREKFNDKWLKRNE
jgi:hypothetical protein